MTTRLTTEELLWFNERYATVEVEGDYCVIRLEDGSVYSTTTFKESLAHMTRRYEAEDWRLAPDWLADPRRRRYPLGFEFDPTSPPSFKFNPDDDRRKYNLYRGFAVNPVEGNISPFLDFTHDIVCNGDQKLFEYVMAWLANIVRCPGDKPGTALVLRGDQGIGKGFFASCLGAVLGDHYVEVNDPVYLVGRFNHHLRDKLVVYADEGSFSGKMASNKLKNIITSERVLIEQKFRTPYTVENYMRVIISGNHERLITASHDERRYCVMEVRPDRKNDPAYWKKMFHWRDNGGAAALLHYLQNHHIEINLRLVPTTEALWDQKHQSLDDFDKWYFDCLQAGQLGPGRRWEEWHPAEELRDSFLYHCGKTYNRSSATQFGTLLKKRVPGATKPRQSLGGRQPYGYRLPPLYECRRAFEERFSVTLDWPQEPPNLKAVEG